MFSIVPSKPATNKTFSFSRKSFMVTDIPINKCCVY